MAEIKIQKKKSSMLPWLIAILLIVALVVGIVYYYNTPAADAKYGNVEDTELPESREP